MTKKEIKDIIEWLEKKVKEKKNTEDLKYWSDSLDFWKKKYNEEHNK